MKILARFFQMMEERKAERRKNKKKLKKLEAELTRPDLVYFYKTGRVDLKTAISMQTYGLGLDGKSG